METNSALQDSTQLPTANYSVPIEKLLVLGGSLNGKVVQILKDDGGSANLVSHEFFKRNSGAFDVISCDIELSHSKKSLVQKSSAVTLGAISKIGNNDYKSNWLVADCGYDVLLGMPWHVAHNPVIDYRKRVVKAGQDDLNTISSTDTELKVTSLSMRNFRKIVKRSPLEVSIFQLIPAVP